MFREIAKWFFYNMPIVTTRKKQGLLIDIWREETRRIEKMFNMVAINTIIHDLENLRADTWNQDKITKIQNFLRENFYVEIQKQKN